MADYNYIISPEVIKGDLFQVKVSGQTVGVYSAMTQVLSGGRNGSSLLTGLTIPILITQNALDCGYYSPFDGAVQQLDVITNFIFSSTTQDPYVYYIYNTSDEFKKYLELSSYKVDWGDGSPQQTIDVKTPLNISHKYPVAVDTYTISLEQKNPWGTNVVKKTITTPFTNPIKFNPQGTATFANSTGSWSATPINYNYIFSGDAENNVQDQISSNFTEVPFIVSGSTTSRIQELAQYGPQSQRFQTNVPIIRDRKIFGIINDISPNFTGYTIEDVDYYDFSDGTTTFFVRSSGLTENELTAEFFYKNPALQKAVGDAEIVTNLYIERGKNTAYQNIQRLGEVDNVGDLVNYGYKYFNVETK